MQIQTHSRVAQLRLLETCVCLINCVRLCLLQTVDILDFSQTCQQDSLRHVVTCLGHVLLAQTCKLKKTCPLTAFPAKELQVYIWIFDHWLFNDQHQCSKPSKVFGGYGPWPLFQPFMNYLANVCGTLQLQKHFNVFKNYI